MVKLNDDQQAAVTLILEDARQKITDLIGKPASVSMRIFTNHISAANIISIVCAQLDIHFSDLLTERKMQELVVGRNVVAWFLHFYCGMTDAAIAEMLHRERSTITANRKTVKDILYTGDALYLEPIKKCEQAILKMNDL